MTNSTLAMSATSTTVAAATSVTLFSSPKALNDRSGTSVAAKPQYRLEQQVKLLHLQAEAESLLQRLHGIKQRQQVAVLGELGQSDEN
jgi:hypothetical protein